MKVLKVIHGFPPDYMAGSEVYSYHLVKELINQNIETHVFTRVANEFHKQHHIYEEVHEGIPILRVNKPKKDYLYTDKFYDENLDEIFKDYLQKVNPDVVHFGHLSHLSTSLIKIVKDFGKPIVYTIHDFWLYCVKGQLINKDKEICPGPSIQNCTSCSPYVVNEEEVTQTTKHMMETIDMVDMFISPSHTLRDFFIDQGVSSKKVKYLKYGFNTNKITFNKKKFTSKSKINFGFMGRVIPTKGIKVLVDVFSELPNQKLSIYGGIGAQKRFLETDNIVFKGAYNNNTINDVLLDIDVLIVPSTWYENAPLVIQEAFLAGVPVITSDLGGMSELVKNGINGFTFKVGDKIALKEVVEKIVNTPTLLNNLTDSRDVVVSIEDDAKEIIKIYEKAIKSKFWRVTIDTNPEDCNLKCIMCEEHSPYSNFIDNLYKETGVRSRRMSFESVQNIFKQAYELGVKELIPSTMGEPLLYKQFDKVFDLAKEYDIKINLTTNGTFPKKSVLDWAKLIVPTTSDIKISWNGATAETSKKVMIGIDFEKALANLKEFIAYRDTYYKENGYFCRVTLQLTFMQNNMHELADIVKLAASLGVDRVKGHQLWDHFDEIKPLSMRSSSENVSKWNTYVKEAHAATDKFRKSNGEKVLLENVTPINDNEIKEVPKTHECPFLEQELWVSATGIISPCCAPDDLRKSLGDFGNIKTSSLEDVLESEKYKELVHNYKTKEVCKTCVMRKPA